MTSFYTTVNFWHVDVQQRRVACAQFFVEAMDARGQLWQRACLLPHLRVHTSACSRACSRCWWRMAARALSHACEHWQYIGAAVILPLTITQFISFAK